MEPASRKEQSREKKRAGRRESAGRRREPGTPCLRRRRSYRRCYGGQPRGPGEAKRRKGKGEKRAEGKTSESSASPPRRAREPGGGPVRRCPGPQAQPGRHPGAQRQGKALPDRRPSLVVRDPDWTERPRKHAAERCRQHAPRRTGAERRVEKGRRPRECGRPDPGSIHGNRGRDRQAEEQASVPEAI